MSNLFPPTASQDAYTGPVTPSEIINPTKILQPRSTSQEIKPYTLTIKLHSAHVHNSNINQYRAGPFTITGGSLLPVGEYVIVKDSGYPFSAMNFYAINIDTQESTLIFTGSEYLANYYNGNPQITFFENKMWIYAIDKYNTSITYTDAYEGLHFTNKVVSVSSLDIANAIIPELASNPSFYISILPAIWNEFKLGTCKYGIYLRVSMGIPGNNSVYLVLINSSGIRLLDTIPYPDSQYLSPTIRQHNSNDSEVMWVDIYIGNSGFAKAVKYDITPTSFTKKESATWYDSNLFKRVINDNTFVLNGYGGTASIYTIKDNGTSLVFNTEYTHSGNYGFAPCLSTDNRWVNWITNGLPIAFVYEDDNSSALPPSIGNISNTGLVTYDYHLLGNTQSGRKFYAYSGTATGLGAGTWDIFFSV